MLNTVKKIGPVLDLFTTERPEWRMTEIARALGMPKSSAHSLVTTLAEVGLLSVGDQGRYQLGWHLVSLAERIRATRNYGEHAVPVMHQLQAATKETVLLAALDRHEVLYLEKVEGTHPMVRLAGVRVGARAPVHCTAVGKVLLAERGPQEVRALLESVGLEARTPNTITTVDAFEDELRRVRVNGFAFDRQEIVADVACVAAPVRDGHGSVIAALSLSLPAYRFAANAKRLVTPLLQASEAISRRISAAQEKTEEQPAALAGAPD